MNTFELKLWDDEGEKCTFYTVHLDGNELNETDSFFDKFDNCPEYKDDTQKLLAYILYVVGDDHGAVNELFNRKENQVDGLPAQGRFKLGEYSYNYLNFPLRIYALKITEEIVILFNGGIKDGPTNQTSTLHLKWVEACQYSKRIIEAFKQGNIIIDYPNRQLKNHQAGEEIII